MNISEAGQFVPDGMKYISEEEYRDREDYCLEAGDVLFNNTNSIDLIGKTCLIEHPLRCGYSNHMTRIRVNPDLCVPRYLALVLHSAWHRGQFRDRATRWVGQAGINTKSLADFEIPLPPLEVQREIVAEIEGYQKVIDGARMVVENYRPHIPIDPEWPMVRLEKLCVSIQNGFPVKQQDDGRYLVTRIQTIADGTIDLSKTKCTNDPVPEDRLMEHGDILFSHINSIDHLGKTAIFRGAPVPVVHGINLIRLRPRTELVDSHFLLWSMKQDHFIETAKSFAQRAVNQASIKVTDIREMAIPLPPLSIQKEIVAEINTEEALVQANRDLIARFEKKIQSTLARVWEDANNR